MGDGTAGRTSGAQRAVPAVDAVRRLGLRRLDEHARAAGQPPPPTVVPVLERLAGDTDFAVLCSDVVYPAGGVLNYGENFYRPYADYPGPIYALPGNHDWYDGLTGFVSNYVAAIGGNDHNYQRYPVLQRDGRTIQYVVNGGGGAYLPATHPIPNMDRLAPAVHEEAFRCYPLRGDSLAHFSRRYDRLLRFGRGGPRRGFPLPAGEAPVPYNWSSLLFDTDEPPMFKSFLRLDATADEIVLSCWAATGCLEHERAPLLEDRARARRGPDGTWRWASETPGRPVP